MNSYANRFADALSQRLVPRGVTVTTARGIVVIERGNARTVVWPANYSQDRRKQPRESDILSALRSSASRLRQNAVSWKAEYRAPALALAAILDGAA